MNPRAYFDIEALGASSTGGGQIPALPVITRLVSALHGIFRLHPGRFALAFPRLKSGDARHPGHLVRVFADTREDLDTIVEALTANPRIHGYVRYGYKKIVPPEFKGPWKEYRRYRIPGTGSRLEKCREYRLAAAERLPYLRMHSKSNGQGFVLFLDCREGTAPLDCEPDSYGLSVPARAFALPMVA